MGTKRDVPRIVIGASLGVLVLGAALGSAWWRALPSASPRADSIDSPFGARDSWAQLGAAALPLRETPMPEGLGLQVPLEDPSGKALSAFHAALRRADAGAGQARLLFYGASHTACDHFVGRIRDVLQQRFGDAGHGFALPAWPDSYPLWQRGVRIDRGRGWTPQRLGSQRSEPDYYGLAGVYFDSGGREARARVATETWGTGQRVSRFEVFTLGQPNGGRLEVRIDGRTAGWIDTATPDIRAKRDTFRTPDGPRTLELRALPGQPVRLYGVALERDVPGVIADNAALSGARARDQLKWREPTYTAHLKARSPDLVVTFYGGNEGDDLEVSIASYARRAEDALQRLRAALPRASCLVMGPADKPLRRGRRWVHRQRTSLIADVQRQLALRHGCAYFDTVAFMGGKLSMLRWRSADPPLARDDRVHLTPKGYKRLGEVLLRNLMRAYTP